MIAKEDRFVNRPAVVINSSALVENTAFKLYLHFGVEPSDIVITAGAAEVVHGLRAETADVDIAATERGFITILRSLVRCKADYDLTVPDGQRLRVTFSRFGYDYDVIMDELGDCIKLGGFNIQSLRGLLDLRTKLGREKDLKMIPIIEAAISGGVK